MRTQLPRAPRLLLRVLLPNDTRDGVIEDIHEIWDGRVRDLGRRAAGRWLWPQVVNSAGPSLRLRWQRRGSGKSRDREGLVQSVSQDIAFALTQLRRHAGIGAVVILTLALGIGATTAIFSAVHGVLMTPLPYDEPSELVMITSTMGGSADTLYLSGPDLVDLIAEVESIEQAVGFGEPTIGPLTEVDRPEHVLVSFVTWNGFDMLGVQATLGRTFVESEGDGFPPETTTFPPAASVISYDFWQTKFGGDPDVLGRIVKVWGGDAEIVGVLPEDFDIILPPELNIGADVDIYRVTRTDLAQGSRERRGYRTVARLAPGATVSSARSELDAFAGRLRERHPHHALEKTRLVITSVEKAVARPIKGPLFVLMGAVSLVLLIACANVANLLLARGAARANELAVRASLGAGRARIVRQLVTESAVLAVLGAVAGIGLAAYGVRALQLLRPPELHRFADVTLDLPVLTFTALVTVAATLLAGLLPALQSAGRSVSGHLTIRGGKALSSRARMGLVVSEVALSVMLLVGAGLLIRTFSELERMPLGFEPDRLLTVTATQTGRPQEKRQAYEAELIEAARQVPGVESVGIVFPLPMNGVYERDAEYVLPGFETDPTAWTSAYYRTISPGYMETMGLELLRGRQFTSSDEVIEAPVVILDARLARAEFPDVDPIGRRLFVRAMQGDTINPEIVGVVEWSPQGDHRDDRPTMYLPRVQYQSHEVAVVAKVTGDPAVTGRALLGAIQSVDAGFPAELRPMSSYISERLAASRFMLILMEVFAGVALMLSAVGLYGVLSYAVRQQSKELGLRLALGALAVSLTTRIVASGAKLAAIGITIGLVGALALGRALETQLFRVSPLDPWAYGGTAVVAMAVSVLASLIPAIRASRVDPVEALRED